MRMVRALAAMWPRPKSVVTPAAPCAWIAQSTTKFSIAGAATLIIAISRRAALLPSRSILSAAFRVSRRAWSIMMRQLAMRSSQIDCSEIGLPNATREDRRLQMRSSSRSATPMLRMQWWMRPGPRRACAISKPRPSPSRMLSAGTRTFSKTISAWPCGASSKPNTGSMRSTCTPGVSIGTMICDCCACFAALGSVLPITMSTLQRVSPAPDDHHLRPLIT